MDKNLTKAHEQVILEVSDIIKDVVPRIVSVEGLNHAQNSFQNQGFTDITLEKWKPRKVPKRNGKKITGKTLEKWKAKNDGRSILISHQSDTKGIHLKDSITAEISPGKVTFHVEKEYGQVHNEGLKAGRPPGFIMPQRMFIGSSEVLENKIVMKSERVIEQRLNSI